VKLDVVTLLTVPAAPPAAGPDRALEPEPLAGAELLDVGAGDVADADVPQAAASPITAHIATAAIHRFFPFGSSRFTLGWAGIVSLSFMMVSSCVGGYTKNASGSCAVHVCGL
jgi:hypothetical protein